MAKTLRMKRTRPSASNPLEYIDDKDMRKNHPLKDGLPHQAYAVAPDINDPATWQLPHHNRLVKRAVIGKIGYEHTVDWQLMEEAVRLISRQGIDGRRIQSQPEHILAAARHLASHYIKASRPLPDALSVLN